ncbi:MAG: DUF3347 domain-containing protein [Flavobacterium sp.]|uniref:DUF3347 domain-containing protein n=1 Tax=Flavobacterium sp. TaxID=239 RepID=UPI0032678B1A
MKNFKRIILAAMLSFSLAGTYAINSPDQNLTVATQDQNSIMVDVYSSYFGIKDALVKSDGKTAAAKASELTKAINALSMDKMKSEEHTVWMKVVSELKEDAEQITGTNDAKNQRNYFVTLSKNMHEVMKAFPAGETIYYQKCPMANGGKGANWLSKDKAVKNPYYGSAMLTCGSTVETLK